MNIAISNGKDSKCHQIHTVIPHHGDIKTILLSSYQIIFIHKIW